ncbi:alpha/beta hydrolase fold domain-containing protein [Streptomyces sp. M10(2022)]
MRPLGIAAAGPYDRGPLASHLPRCVGCCRTVPSGGPCRHRDAPSRGAGVASLPSRLMPRCCKSWATSVATRTRRRRSTGSPATGCARGPTARRAGWGTRYRPPSATSGLARLRGRGADAHPDRHAVYVHGGAWINEIVAQHWRLVAQLAATTRTRFTVPIYPLAPRGRPLTSSGVAGLLRDLAARHGPENVSVMGDSAGGQIALSAALLLRGEGIALRRTVLISPALDLSLDNPEIDEVEPRDPWLARPGIREAVKLWRAHLPLDDLLVSPCSPTLGPRSDFGVRRHRRHHLSRHPHPGPRGSRSRGDGGFPRGPGMVHVYPLLPIPEGRQARKAMAALLRD